MTAAEPTPREPSPGPLPDADYRRMADVLRVGLLVALGLLTVALVALVAHAPDSSSGGWISTNPLVRYLDVRALGRGLATGAPEAYLTLGVYALIATPVVRVASGTYAFFRHRERRLATITAIVLVLLLVGLLVLGPLVR